MTEQEKRIEEIIYRIYLDDESGGALHIVLGDGNFEDNHIKYCLEYSIPNIQDCERRALYEECAKELLGLKVSRRYSLTCSAWNIYRKAYEVRKEIFDKLTETFMEMTAYGSDSNQHAGYYDYSIKVSEVIEIIAEVLGFEYNDYEEHPNKHNLRNWLKEKYGVEVKE